MYRNVSATSWFPDVLWHRSYGVDAPGRVRGFCIYEGPSAAAVVEQSRFCGVPFVGIKQVEEHRAPGVGAGPDEIPAEMALYLLEWLIPTRRPPNEVWRALTNSLSEPPAVKWIRSFFDAESGASRCILLAESQAAVEAAVPAGAKTDRLERMWLSHPATWAHLYDSMGLPHHWEAAATVTSLPHVV